MNKHLLTSSKHKATTLFQFIPLCLYDKGFRISALA